MRDSVGRLSTEAIEPVECNLIDDGDRWLYRYDLLGQLVEVRARNAPSGHVFAKFTYNALGWRTSAAYDLNGDGSVLNDSRELYTYDEPAACGTA